MEFYDALPRNNSEAVTALSVDGAYLALDPKRFIVQVFGHDMVRLVPHGRSDLAVTLPLELFRVLHPHRPVYIDPPQSARDFALGAGRVRTGGTGCITHCDVSGCVTTCDLRHPLSRHDAGFSKA